MAGKSEWRRRIRANRRGRVRRAAESAGLVRNARAALAAFDVQAGDPSRPVALFAPVPSEPDVTAVIEDLSPVLLPVLEVGGTPLEGPAWGVAVDGSALVRPRPGLPAHPTGEVEGPQALSRAPLVFLPALAVDRRGVRLGQGGGWYDRALTHRAPGTPLVAVVFEDEYLEDLLLPAEPHDIPVDAVVTPERFRDLRG